MPKSYKITYTNEFNRTEYSYKPYNLNNAMDMPGIMPGPQSTIYETRDQIALDDFRKYLIEHELIENVLGRTGDYAFQSYIRKENIYAYQSNNAKTLLLSGKKKYVTDFCGKTKQNNSIKISVVDINMGDLLAKLPHVKGVWFSFQKGLIRSSALMGADIESTDDFIKYKTEGDISTLSFYYEYKNIKHSVMVTSDGTIVLYAVYKEITDEIEIVLDIKNKLLYDIQNIIPV
ncbi:MAG: hypothetical protein Q7U71_07770 [bacterium]|nr:hypothetical protein [bacterium]